MSALFWVVVGVGIGALGMMTIMTWFALDDSEFDG